MQWERLQRPDSPLGGAAGASPRSLCETGGQGRDITQARTLAEALRRPHRGLWRRRFSRPAGATGHCGRHARAGRRTRSRPANRSVQGAQRRGMGRRLAQARATRGHRLRPIRPSRPGFLYSRAPGSGWHQISTQPSLPADSWLDCPRKSPRPDRGPKACERPLPRKSVASPRASARRAKA